MKTRTGILFSSILASAAILAGCAAGEASNAPAAPPAPSVTTAVVATHELSDWADFTGRLEAVENVAVRPRVGGYVESVGFTEGARVAKGDLLFQIDPRPFQAEVDRLTAERDRARAEVELARTYRDRAERLLAQNATSREEAEQIEADAAVAQAKLAAARRGPRRRAAESLVHARHRADRRPRVARRSSRPATSSTARRLLTTVVSDSPVYAYFDIDEQTYLASTCATARTASGSTVHVGPHQRAGLSARRAARLRRQPASTPTTARSARARCSTTPTAASRPACSSRMQAREPEQLSRRARRRPRDRHRLGRKFVFVVDGHERRRSTARSVTGRSVEGLRVIKQRPRRRRRRDRQRPAARAPGRRR